MSTRSLFPLILAALLTPFAAQATINVEEIRLDPGEDGFASEFEVGGSVKTGNVEYFDASVGIGASYRTGANVAFIIAERTYAAKRSGSDLESGTIGLLLQEDARYDNEGSAHVRYNREFNEKFAGELFAQVEFDEFLRIDLRQLAGVGGRFGLLQSDTTSIHAGLGYMLEDERYDPDEVVEEELEQLAHRATSYFALVHANEEETHEARFTAYFQPRLTDFSDYRFITDAELELALTEKIAVEIGVTVRMDSDPPVVLEGESEIRPLDTTTSTGFSITF